MIAIVIIGVVMAAILLYRHYVKKETLQFENSFYFLMVYGLFVLMSALFQSISIGYPVELMNFLSLCG